MCMAHDSEMKWCLYELWQIQLISGYQCEGQGNRSGTHQGFFGNLPNFQGQAAFPQPTQAVASQIQNANSQGNDCPIQQNLGFQALLSQANLGLDDVPTNETAQGQWRVHSAYNGNHPL